MGRFFSNSDIVLFQGDSITDCHRSREDIGNLGNGYPALVKAIYNTLVPSNTTTFVNKGISGDRVRDLIERYHEDFFEIQPTFISIMIGINDVWRAFDRNEPCPLERFQQEYVKLLEMIRKDFPAVKIMLIEPFVLHSLPDRKDWHPDLDPKRAFVKSLAKEYANYFLPLHSILTEKAKTEFSDAVLAEDGVHPSSVGHAVIAAEYLKLLDVL